MIKVSEVNVIDSEGEALGTLPIDEAMNLAEERGMDLVEVAPEAKPPVCRIMDFGKHKYRLSKRAHEAKKNQKITHVKEISRG
jgi:translation initiation factor IF-3